MVPLPTANCGRGMCASFWSAGMCHVCTSHMESKYAQVPCVRLACTHCTSPDQNPPTNSVPPPHIQLRLAVVVWLRPRPQQHVPLHPLQTRTQAWWGVAVRPHRLGVQLRRAGEQMAVALVGCCSEGSCLHLRAVAGTSGQLVVYQPRVALSGPDASTVGVACCCLSAA